MKNKHPLDVDSAADRIAELERILRVREIELDKQAQRAAKAEAETASSNRRHRRRTGEPRK